MRFRAQDGHICDSRDEMVIDDFLSSNDIVHIKNYPYPNSRKTCDFKVALKMMIWSNP